VGIKLGITGTRQFSDQNWVEDRLDEMYSPADIEVLISGGARGIDTCCEIWARKHSVAIDVHKPDYDQYGKGAPLVRNDEMIALCDEMVGFPLPDASSRGTEYTIAHAIKAGKPVRVVPVPIR
jgi:hypothetical protein